MIPTYHYTCKIIFKKVLTRIGAGCIKEGRANIQVAGYMAGIKPKTISPLRWRKGSTMQNKTMFHQRIIPKLFQIPNKISTIKWGKEEEMKTSIFSKKLAVLFITISFLMVSMSMAALHLSSHILNTPNYALLFDGQDDFVQIPDNSAYSFNSTFSVEAWVNFKTISNLNGSIVSKDDSISSREFGLEVTCGLQFVVFSDNNTWDYARFSNPSLNTWHHVAGVYDGSSIYLYLDGNLVASQNHIGSIPHTSVPLTFGNWFAQSRPLSGTLDEVRMWNIARTKEDIVNNMNNSLIGNEHGLVGYWKFDEENGQIVHDSSIIGNDGFLGYSLSEDNCDPQRVLSDAPIGDVPPNPPVNLNYVYDSSSNSFLVSWNSNTESDLAGYNIYRKTSNTNYQKLNSNLLTTPTFSDFSIQRNVLYFYAVSALDTAGNESDLSNTITAYYGDAPSGPGDCLTFDNINDRVVIPDSPSLAFNNKSITVEAWIKPNYAYYPGHVISKNDSPSRRDFEFSIDYPTGNIQFIIFSDNNNWIYARGGQLQSNVWQHVAGVYDGASIYTYVNGYLASSIPCTTAINHTDVPVTIGNWFTGDRPFNGQIDEVRVWNIARMRSDIRSTMFTSLYGNESGLVGYWKFDEGAGQSAMDASGHGNNGTLGTSNGVDDADPLWTVSGAPLNTSDTTKPLAPVNITARGGNGKIYLQWDSNDNWADSYNVYRRTESTDFIKVNGDLIEETSYDDNDVTNNVTYYYVVRSYSNSSIESDNSLEVSAVPRESGYGLQFDGLNDVVTVPDNSSLNVDSTLTLEAWIYPQAYSNLNGVVAGKDNGQDKREYFLAVNDGLYFVVHQSYNSWDYIRVSNPSLNSWHHVAGVYDGSSIKLYLDGTFMGSVCHTGLIPNTDTPFLIGNWLPLDRSFKGLISEVRLWNIARDQSSIQSTMNTYLNGNEPGLIGYWRLSEGSGQIAADSSGNGNNGYLGTSTATDDSDPVWTESDVPLNPVNLPSPPSLFAAGQYQQVQLNWDLSSVTDVAGYNIFRKTADSDYRKLNQGLININGFTDQNVSIGTTYYYVVHTITNQDEESLNSNEVSAIPKQAPPMAPTNLNSNSGNKFVQLMWSVNTESDVIGYNIYRNYGGNGFTKLNSSPIAGIFYKDTNVTNEVQYSYIITAVDSTDQESTPSLAVSATPHLMLNELSVATDTLRWAYEIEPGSSGSLPAIHWLSGYDGATGVMRIDFTQADQGLKMTLQIPEWFNSATGKWYLLQMKVCSEQANGVPINVLSMLFNGILPGSADVTGSVIYSLNTSWQVQSAYLPAVTNSSTVYAQFILHNNSTPTTSIYIDSVQILEVAPPTLTNSVFAGADFDVASDTTYWGFEPYGNIPAMPSFSVVSGQLDVTFDGLLARSMKMTMKSSPGKTSTVKVAASPSLAGQSVKLSYAGDTSKDSLIMAIVFGTDVQGGTTIKEFAAHARINKLIPGANDPFIAAYYPNYPYFYGQIVVSNANAGDIFLDDLYPVTGTVAANNVSANLLP